MEYINIFDIAILFGFALIFGLIEYFENTRELKDLDHKILKVLLWVWFLISPIYFAYRFYLIINNLNITFKIGLFFIWLIPLILFVPVAFIVLKTIKEKTNKEKWKEKFLDIIVFSTYFLLFFAIEWFFFLVYSYLMQNPNYTPIFIASMTTIILAFYSNDVLFEQPDQEKSKIKDYLERLFEFRIVSKRILLPTIAISTFIINILLVYSNIYDTTISTISNIYSTICQTFASLLALIFVLSIFVLEKKTEETNIKDLFVRTMKGVTIIYGFVIVISFLGMIFHVGINTNINSVFDLKLIIGTSIFFITISLAYFSFWFTIIAFKEMVDVFS